MENFTYYTPTKVVFGASKEYEVGRLLKDYNMTKVLVLYGKGSAEKSGLIETVKSAIQNEGIIATFMGGVSPNPLLSFVREAIKKGREDGVNSILAVGGGSVIDTAKAVAVGILDDEHDIWEYYEGKHQPDNALPVASVLTIAAAGSEMSGGTVLTNDATKEKRSFGGEKIRPVFTVMNPVLTLSLPVTSTMAGCADVLMHTMERYFSAGEHMELTDRISESIMTSVITTARRLYNTPADIDARAELMWASSLSHNGLTECGNTETDWAVHALEHELSGFFDVTHGAGLTAVWSTWARYVYRYCLPRFERFAINVMKVDIAENPEETALSGINALESFFKEIGLPVNISELGINLTHTDIENMSSSCISGRGDELGSARKLNKSDVQAIYRMASK